MVELTPATKPVEQATSKIGPWLNVQIFPVRGLTPISRAIWAVLFIQLRAEYQ
jgi:hypothetical protein